MNWLTTKFWQFGYSYLLKQDQTVFNTLRNLLVPQGKNKSGEIVLINNEHWIDIN